MIKPYDHLDDEAFLTKLYASPIREQYAKIVLLTFDEKPIREIHGMITNGSLSANGSTAVRRTVSFQMVASEIINDLTNIDYLISINKKIKLEIGLNNPFSHSDYDPILWFPMGIYTISTANISRGINSTNISVTAKDKMSKLDGSVGGSFLATINFHEREEIDSSGVIRITAPTIYQIIMEAVHHFGQEDLYNIFIDDIDETASILVKYAGDLPIWFNSDYSGFQIADEDDITGDENSLKKIVTGQKVGYRLTDFTYPGELVLGPGETVATLLDKIAKTLGNFEYFYDVYGKFHFQRIKNYTKNISQLNQGTTITLDNYFADYSNSSKYYFDEQMITQINQNPKFDNIKNDFTVIGKKQSVTGKDLPLRYHVMLEEKPNLNLCHMVRVATSRRQDDLRQITQEFMISSPPEDTSSSIEVNMTQNQNKGSLGTITATYSENTDPYKNDIIFKIASNNYDSYIYKCNKIIIDGKSYSNTRNTDKIRILNSSPLIFPTNFFEFEAEDGEILYKAILTPGTEIMLELESISKKNPADEKVLDFNKDSLTATIDSIVKIIIPEGTNGGWREELYRRALLDQEAGRQNVYEQAELIANWRNIYDPSKEEWINTEIDSEKRGWNPDVFDDPANLAYWLDYIDYPKYSISAIGRRSKVVSEDKVNSLWLPEIPQVMFYDAAQAALYTNFEKNGYTYFQLSPGYSNLFTTADSSIAAIDTLREIIRQHLSYNSQFSITCLPVYHLEPNSLIHIYNQWLGVDADYQMTQFTLPLAYNGTMSITATEVINQY